MRYLQERNGWFERLVRMSPAWVFVGLVGLFLAGTVQAGELETCIMNRLIQTSDSTTVGELRKLCSEQIEREAGLEREEAPAIVAERLTEDKENTLQPFTLLAFKPNYLLVGAHNSKGYDPTVFQEQYDDPTIDFDKTEAQFQLSLKIPLIVGAFDKFDLYAGYTNRSFWQVYNGDISRPFRETNHQPEMWMQFEPSWEIFGFKNVANMFGVVHQSNGRGGLLSRSWNRVWANFVFAKGNFAFEVLPWVRISEDKEDDDNPDIIDYMGHFEFRAAYKRKDHVFSFMSRNHLESSFDKGALELSWSFPLFHYPYLKGYVQYFNGYGESLIDYDRKVNRIGVGIMLSDWL